MCVPSVALHVLSYIVQFSRCTSSHAARFSGLSFDGVRYFQPRLKPDLKVHLSLGFEIQQQISLLGGPEWARTTDLAIISRTL